MAREQEQFLAEIVKRSPNAGPSDFSVKIEHSLPDFVGSVNFKYVKRGYHYLIAHSYRLYFLIAPLPIVIFSAQIGKLTWDLDFCRPKCDLFDSLFLLGLLALVLLLLLLYIFLHLTPRSIYLLDFACYHPPDELKISKEEFIQLARKSGNFSDASIEFQQRVLKNSGIGDKSYMPRVVFRPDYKVSLKDGREEAAMVMFGAVNQVFAATKIRPKDISILVVNCGVLNTTPSLSSMVINHFKLRHNFQSFYLGGMGCAAGIIAIDLTEDLLKAYPGSYALVVSTEAVGFTWYIGNDLDMLLPNCFFRMGALPCCSLAPEETDGEPSINSTSQVVRTHKGMGMDERSFNSIRTKEDVKGAQGLSVSKDVLEAGGHALKANVPLLLIQDSQRLHFLINKTAKPYNIDIRNYIEHVCILATSKKVLDEIHYNLELTEEHIEASRKTLERFGNTSSSSVWYELGYLEWRRKIKKGVQVCQIAFGSGFKCCSVVWKALGRPKQHRPSPWDEED